MQSPELRFDAISRGLNLVTSNIGPCLLGGLCYLVAIIAVGVVQQVMGFSAMAVFRNGLSLLAILPMMLVSILLGGALQGIFIVCMQTMMYEGLQKGRLDFADFTKGFTKAGPAAILGIIVQFATFVGAICCVVPAFIVAGLLVFSYMEMAAKGVGFQEAIQGSMNITRPQLAMAALWTFVVYLVAGVGAFACYVGILFTLPVAMATIAIAYVDINGLPGAQAAQTFGGPMSPPPGAPPAGTPPTETPPQP